MEREADRSTGLAPGSVVRASSGRFAPTVAGRILLGSIVLVTAFDLALGGGVGFLPCFLLALGCVAAWLTWRNLAGLEVAAELPGEVWLAQRFPARYLLRSRRAARDLFLAYESELSASGALAGMVMELPGRTDEVRELGLRLERRGRHRTHRLFVSSSFPAFLFERRLEFDLPVDVLVLPRVRRVRAFESDSRVPRSFAERTSLHRQGRGEFRSLREWRMGDGRARVHWKASARHGRPLVRELEGEACRRLELVFDPRCARPDAARTRALFELGVSLAASLAFDWLVRGDTVELRVLGGDRAQLLTGRGDLRRGLRRLAVTEPRERGARLDEPVHRGPASRGHAADARIAVRFGAPDPDAAPAGLEIDVEDRETRRLFAPTRRAGEALSFVPSEREGAR